MEVIWIDGGNYNTEFPKYGFSMDEVEIVNLPKTEKNPFIVGVNGVVFAIAAGEELQVPLAIFDVLQKEFDEKKKDITPAITTADNFVIHINVVKEYGEIVSASCGASVKDILAAYENGVICAVVLHINEVLIGGERKQDVIKFRTADAWSCYVFEGGVGIQASVYDDGIEDFLNKNFEIHEDHTVTIEDQ